MPARPQKNKPRKDVVEPYSFSDEITQKKIQRHIHDKNDVITEADIARVKIPGVEMMPVTTDENKDEKKENIPPGAPSEGKPLTPWDILD